MNINPMQVIQMFLGRGQGNPAIQNVINMMQNGDDKGLEQYARNLCNERGIPVDKAVDDIKRMFQG